MDDGFSSVRLFTWSCAVLMQRVLQTGHIQRVGGQPTLYLAWRDLFRINLLKKSSLLRYIRLICHNVKLPGLCFLQDLSPRDLVYVDSLVKPSETHYDPLFPEVQEVLGGIHPSRPCTLVWRDLSVHIKLKDGKLKRLVNNGTF